MKLAVVLLALGFCLSAEDKKSLPNQAGNDDVELAGTVLLDRTAVQQALGADLGEGFVAVRIKVTPKIGKPMRISADDFTLLSRKDGERSSALAPSQIAGKAALTVHPAQRQPGGLGTMSNGPIWGGIGGSMPQRLPGNSPSAGNTGSVEGGTADATLDRGKKDAPENPLMAVLKAKGLPDVETKEPVEGLLYFTLEGKKLKPKDTALLYKGDGGRLVIDFK
jgi:hypothetical protein